MDEPVRVFTARRFHTFDADMAEARAVAVRAGRIVAVGTLDDVIARLAGAAFDLDDTLADHVVLPGLIDQHLHPLLGATTLATQVIATEDWVLPGRTFPAARTHTHYLAALTAAERALDEPDEWLLSWGYHSLWHGRLDRDVLDSVSDSRPIAIWQRSCHEFFLNSVAIERLDLSPDRLATGGPSAALIDLERGHAWEGGCFDIVLPAIAPVLISRERMEFGLRQLAAYLHQHGVTAYNEPGIAWGTEPVDLYEEILGADDIPIWSTFVLNGRIQHVKGVPADAAVDDAVGMLDRLPADGKVCLFRDQIKLFADGAIISQLMVMQDPYVDTDGNPDPTHRGEWMMEPADLRAYFAAYWAAGWQIHTHVNGDHGLEVLLDIIEECQRSDPRDDHRSVVVHFANSTEAQVERIARLGAIVSANPYYTVGFADQYGAFGLGPERADAMVRSRSVLRHRVPLSFHSDLPMAPAQPLFLAWCAVNRRTPSGRVAGPDQRIDVREALAAVTIGAAYSWRREHEVGSIAVGKRANFTVLDADPFEVDAADLYRIPVVGTVYEGRWHPVPDDLRAPPLRSASAPSAAVHDPRIGPHPLEHDHWLEHDHGGCSCELARRLEQLYRELNAA